MPSSEAMVRPVSDEQEVLRNPLCRTSSSCETKKWHDFKMLQIVGGIIKTSFRCDDPEHQDQDCQSALTAITTSAGLSN